MTNRSGNFRLTHALWMAGVVVGVVGIMATYALSQQEKENGIMDTGLLGGVPHPTEEELAAMQKGQYILHARGGKLTKVPVEKSRLPHDPWGHVQIEETAVGPDGAVYVNQSTIMCKSTDGERIIIQ